MIVNLKLFFLFTESAEEKIISSLQNVKHIKVYKKSEIPQEYHYSRNRRILEILLVADKGYTITELRSENYTGSKDNSNLDRKSRNRFCLSHYITYNCILIW